MLTRAGYVVLSDDGVRQAKRELVVSPIDLSGIGFPKKFKVYDDRDGCVVPKYWGIDVLGKPINEHFGTVKTITATFCGTLRADLEQPKAVDFVLRKMKASGGGAVLSLGTGGGKTVVACHLIAHLGVKTVVLVHKDVLRVQWAQRIEQFLPGTSVSFVKGTTVDLSGDIIIAMIQTVVSRAVAWEGIGYVIADETHHLGAEVFSTSLRGLCTPYTLGLSATPERKDGLTKIVFWFMGPLAYQSARQDMGHVVVDVVRYDCPAYRQLPPQTRFGNVDYPAVMSDLVDDVARTDRIVREILAILHKEPTRSVLVLSHRRDHCTELARKIPGAVAFLGTQGKKRTHDDHLVARVVCATFALASEGYDDARLDTLVLATPCSDVTQAAGRILRGTSAAAPRIIDFLDEWGVCWAMGSKRQTYYRKAGFTVKRRGKDAGAGGATRPAPTPLGAGKCIIIDD